MKLILAPLRGLTEQPFRTAFSRHFDGIDEALAPFIATARAERLRAAHIRDLLPQKQSMPVVPQLLSNNPHDFLALAHKLYDLGFPTVNWNLGCPYPMVAKKKRGSGLLPYPAMIKAFLETVLPGLKPRLSLKLRLGYYDAGEIRALIPVLNAFDLESVTLHPRLGVQMYDGRADVQAFAEVAAQLKHKLIYNGDINSLTAFARLRWQLPDIDAFMLGRYLLVNPFLAEELRGGKITLHDRRERFSAFYGELYECYRAKIPHPQHLMDRMKAYWFYFAVVFDADSRAAVKKIQRAQTLDSFRRHTEAFLRVYPNPVAEPWLQ